MVLSKHFFSAYLLNSAPLLIHHTQISSALVQLLDFLLFSQMRKQLQQQYLLLHVLQLM